MSTCVTDKAEMQCFCDYDKTRKCRNYIDYMHHHDWSEPSDYLCRDCLTYCEKDKANDLKKQSQSQTHNQN